MKCVMLGYGLPSLPPPQYYSPWLDYHHLPQYTQSPPHIHAFPRIFCEIFMNIMFTSIYFLVYVRVGCASNRGQHHLHLMSHNPTIYCHIQHIFITYLSHLDRVDHTCIIISEAHTTLILFSVFYRLFSDLNPASSPSSL